MHTDGPGVTDLLRRASDDLTPDIDRLVSGGMARGRSRQRRARLATTVASLAVIGVVGGLAAVVPDAGPDPTAASIATDGASETPTPAPTTEPTPASAVFGVTPIDFPATVSEILGLTDVTPALGGPPWMVQDSWDIKRSSFRVEGMLVTMIVFSNQVAEDAWHGDRSTPQTALRNEGGVTIRSAQAWRNGYVIVVLAHNAAEGFNSPALAAEPVLSESQLLQVVTSDVWFEDRQ